MNRTLVFYGLLMAVWCGSPVLLAQETAAERHAMATNQLIRLAQAMSERCLREVDSLEGWNRQRAGLREQLLDMLGLNPWPERTPLDAEITGRLDRSAYTIEKLVFQSSPGLYVTGNVYLPAGLKEPAATVLYVCGHSPDPKGA